MKSHVGSSTRRKKEREKSFRMMHKMGRKREGQMDLKIALHT